MTAEEYFGDWSRIIDMKELGVVLNKLNKVNPALICPSLNNVFKAFELCSHRDLKVVMLGMDPYPQKGVATGVLFGNKVGSHTMLWRPFISKLLKNLSEHDTGIIYVLFGRQAQTFEPYINKQFNDIIKVEHPAYFARTGKIMPYSVFTDINKLLKGKYGTEIEWYQDSNNNLINEENETERDSSDDFFWSCPL